MCGGGGEGRGEGGGKRNSNFRLLFYPVLSVNDLSDKQNSSTLSLMRDFSMHLQLQLAKSNLLALRKHAYSNI